MKKESLSPTTHNILLINHHETIFHFLKWKLPCEERSTLIFHFKSAVANLVVFSGEIQFNSDRLHCFNYNFYDLWKGKGFLVCRCRREDGSMVWGKSLYYGILYLEFQTTNVTANSHKSVLQTAFSTFRDLFWSYLSSL